MYISGNVQTQMVLVQGMAKPLHDCICFSWIIFTLFAINSYMANQITEVTSLKSTISSECMLRRVGVCGIKWPIVIIWPTWSLVTFQLNCTALWIWLSSISCAGETNKLWLGQTRGSLQYCSIHFFQNQHHPQPTVWILVLQQSISKDRTNNC